METLIYKVHREIKIMPYQKYEMYENHKLYVIDCKIHLFFLLISVTIIASVYENVSKCH